MIRLFFIYKMFVRLNKLKFLYYYMVMRNCVFYSKHCKHSSELIQQLSKTDYAKSLLYISVDDPSMEPVLMVAQVDRVPTMVINNEYLVGSSAFTWLQQQTDGFQKPDFSSLQGQGIHQAPSNRPHVVQSEKISDRHLENLIAQRQNDLLPPITRT